MRYVLLDRIETLQPPIAIGVKCVSLSDDVFGQHFPGYPLLPGALILESMAQIAGVLLEECMRRERGDDGLHAVLSMADRVRFRRQVRPGDRMLVEASLVRVSADGGQCDVVARVEEHKVAEAKLGFAFSEVTDPRLLQTRREVLQTWLTGSIG